MLYIKAVTDGLLIRGQDVSEYQQDMKLGRNVARTFLDYYKLNNLIKDNIPHQLRSIDVMPKAIKNNTGKGAGIGRNTADREKEKNVRH